MVPNFWSVTRIGQKKKKLKINIHRPAATGVVFDKEGNTLPPLAAIADMTGGGSPVIHKEKVNTRYAELREEMKVQDKEDKLLERRRLKEKRMKEKNKLQRGKDEDKDVEGEDDSSESDRAGSGLKPGKKSKIYFDSDSDADESKGGGKTI